MDKKNKTSKIQCEICGFEDHYLPDHLMEEHQVTVDDYLEAHPDSPTVSKFLMAEYEKEKGSPRRKTPPKVEDLTVPFAIVNPTVNFDVPEEDCLPMPSHYRIPRHGKLGRDVLHAAISLHKGRSMYVWGLPGTGKDALFHAWSWMTRTPSKIFSVRPGVDIQSWLYTRAFDKDGTSWEEGTLLKALRDGYTTTTGRRIPYMILITDFDRADRSQAEAMRLIMDSIHGRVNGPGGVTYPVFPGTQICVTANSAGSGDARGRCISANPIDASILDRFERKYEFHWLDWKDEGPVIREKFPLLNERSPDALEMAGRATQVIRAAIYADDLYAEFSHRALCAWLGHAEDLIECSGSRAMPSNLLKKAARCFLDGMPDEETKLACKRLMDPYLKGGALDEGDTSHIHDEDLADAWDDFMS